jgi:hypothetical protein
MPAHEVFGTKRGRPIVILAHGAGAGMNHAFMQGTAEGLDRNGYTAVLFNFPYMDRTAEDGKRRPPDKTEKLVATWREMLDEVAGWPGRGKIAIGGKSMGGRIASMLLAARAAPEADAAVYLGYPLHPPGKQEKLRADHLSDVPVPQLFISGSRDNLCDLDLLRPVLDKVDDARLHVIEGANHSLAIGRKDPLGLAENWLSAMGEFLRPILL